MRQCSSVTFMRLPFIKRAAPNFVSDPDRLVLMSYTPAYVQSQIDLLKRQKKFTTKLVFEKPKLPPKKSEGDSAKGQPADPKGGSAQDLLKGQSDPEPQQGSVPTASADPIPTADPVPSSSHYTRSRDPKSVKIRKAGSGTGAIIPPVYKKQRAYRGDASRYSLKNASQLKRLQDYLGSMEALKPVPPQRMGIACFQLLNGELTFLKNILLTSLRDKLLLLSVSILISSSGNWKLEYKVLMEVTGCPKQSTSKKKRMVLLNLMK